MSIQKVIKVIEESELFYEKTFIYIWKIDSYRNKFYIPSHLLNSKLMISAKNLDMLQCSIRK